MFFDGSMRKILKSAKGQIAIFVVLVFQVLFILFAMTINVGLVVHDKINLQNSLDLAAYYGAKKQAEVLNAMAHINYQMRQNWKLLAWRYRILGTLLQDHGHHKDEGSKEYWCPQNDPYQTVRCNRPDSSWQQACRSAISKYTSAGIYKPSTRYCDFAYFICISNKLWQRGMSDNLSSQNLCEKHNVNIQPITDLDITAPFVPSAIIAAQGVRNLMGTATATCKMEGALNWFMAQMFLTHFRLDQKDRKMMIRKIYEKTLKVEIDLDKNPIKKGVKQVFYKNLTLANRTAVQNLPDYGLKLFSSFTGEKFRDVFKYLNVRPVLHYLSIVGGSGSCDRKIKPHYVYDSDTNNWWDDFLTDLTNTTNGEDHPLRQVVDNDDVVKGFFSLNIGNRGNNYMTDEKLNNHPIEGLTLGFSKNKEKILYYGLKADIPEYKPNIFSLGTSIKFKASAFAKPFGGQFGPQKDDQSEKVGDPLIPIFKGGLHPNNVKNQAPQVNILKRNHDFVLQPNYSRWPGDKWGLIHYKLHSNDSNNPYSNFLNKHYAYGDDPNPKKKVYTYSAFAHLILWNRHGPADPLARPPKDVQNLNAGVDPFNFMRMMELMAVYPDVYDISNYSILGNYHQTYFPKICKLLTQSSSCDSGKKKFSSNPDAYVRGDFGLPFNSDYIKKNQDKFSNIKTELSIAPYFLKKDDNETDIERGIITHSPQGGGGGGQLPPIIGRTSPNHSTDALTQGKIFYPWLAQTLPDHLLSSWYPTREPDRYLNYNQAASLALTCDGLAVEGSPVPTACAAGGRSGYSVKLISCSAIREMSTATKRPDTFDSEGWCSPPP